MFWLVVCLAISSGIKVMAQPPQLVILKGERVLIRLNPGDDFVYQLKGSKKRFHSYVNNLNDTSILAHRTVVPLSKIRRVYFKRSTLGNRIGGVMVTGAVGYFLIDQFNVSIVQGREPSIDAGVARTSVGLLTVGLPLMLIKPNSVKLKGRYRALVVRKGSGFYRPEPKLEGVW